MGKFRVKIEKQVKTDIEKHIKSRNKSSIKKIENHLLELSNNPYVGTGQSEQLRHDLQGFWSRRINQKDIRIFRKVE